MFLLRLPTIALGFVATAGLGLLLGCDPGADSSPLDEKLIAAGRAKLLLSEEPSGAVTALDLRDQEGGFEQGEVVLVGQIGGMPNPWAETEKAFPWVVDEATFFLVDPATAAEFVDHENSDPEHVANCPFCAREAQKNKDAIVAVTFTDEQGDPIAVAADRLLGLNENDVVVVRGHGRLLAGDLLVVEAEGIYIRQ